MSINYNVVVCSIILYCLITLSYFSMSCVAVLYYNKWYIPLRCSYFCTDKYCCIDNTILLCLVILFLHSNNVIMCHSILVCHNLILSRNILMFVFTNYNPVMCLLLYYIVVLSIIIMFYCFFMVVCTVILLWCVLWCGSVIFLYCSVRTGFRY